MIDKVIKDVINEMTRSQMAYPTNEIRFSVLTEEIMELYQAWNDREMVKVTDAEIYLEGVQSMAMLLRLLVEGDSKYKYKGLKDIKKINRNELTIEGVVYYLPKLNNKLDFIIKFLNKQSDIIVFYNKDGMISWTI